MSATQPIWTDEPRHYERVLYACSALGDTEDDFPTREFMPENDDSDQHRNTPTISAPPPSAEETRPDASERPAIAPPAPSVPRATSDSLLRDCIDQLIEGNESLKRIRFDLLDTDGAFAERQREHRRELVRELKEAVLPRVARLEETVQTLKKTVEDLRTQVTRQQADLDEINKLLPELEKALEDAETRAATAKTQAAVTT